MNTNLILLNSNSGRFPNGLGNDSGVLGKFVPFIITGPVFRQSTMDSRIAPLMEEDLQVPICPVSQCI